MPMRVVPGRTVPNASRVDEITSISSIHRPAPGLVLEATVHGTHPRSDPADLGATPTVPTAGRRAVGNGPSGSAPASVSAVLAKHLQGRADPEANYLRAIYYLAG